VTLDVYTMHTYREDLLEDLDEAPEAPVTAVTLDT